MNTIEVGCAVICIWLIAEWLRRATERKEKELAEMRVKRFFENHPDCVCSLRLIRKAVRMHPTYVCLGVCKLVQEGHLMERLPDTVRNASIVSVKDTLTPENMSLFSYCLKK